MSSEGSQQWKVVAVDREGWTAIVMVDESLREHRTSGRLPWHLSIQIECRETDARGMPTLGEQAVLEAEQADLEQRLGSNARLLARITWKRIRELILRVERPEPAAAVLRAKISGSMHARPFSFRMERDDTWAEDSGLLD